MKKGLTVLLALFLAAGTGLTAAAEKWPSEVLHDDKGNSYKQVFTDDGGVQVWQLIGVFGSAEEALQSVKITIPKKKGGAGKTEIASKPYDYETKKKTDDDGAVKETKKKKRTRKRGYRWASRRKNLQKTIPVSQVQDVFSRVYIQDSRGSGR